MGDGALDESFAWRGRDVRWQRLGSGPSLVFCRRNALVSQLWRPFAEALATSQYRPPLGHAGYGRS